jgi:guanine deaminase
MNDVSHQQDLISQGGRFKKPCALRGTFCDFIDDQWRHVGHEPDAARFIRDGLLVVKGGVVEDCWIYADGSRRNPTLRSPTCPTE